MTTPRQRLIHVIAFLLSSVVHGSVGLMTHEIPVLSIIWPCGFITLCLSLSYILHGTRMFRQILLIVVIGSCLLPFSVCAFIAKVAGS